MPRTSWRICLEIDVRSSNLAAQEAAARDVRGGRWRKLFCIRQFHNKFVDFFLTITKIDLNPSYQEAAARDDHGGGGGSGLPLRARAARCGEDALSLARALSLAPPLYLSPSLSLSLSLLLCLSLSHFHSFSLHPPLSVNLFLYLSRSLSLCLSVFLSLYLSLSLSLSLSSWGATPVQGRLAHKKIPPPRTQQ